MTTQNFDYEQFSEFAKQEAEKFLPKDIDDERKDFILNSFSQFALKTGKVLSLDPTLKLDNEQKVINRSKYILEWIFKTLVALTESSIPRECWHGFILDIGYIAFDISKEIINVELISEEQIKATVEFHVINKIKSLLENLYNTQLITEDIIDDFWKHPYMNKSVENIEFSIYSDY